MATIEQLSIEINASAQKANSAVTTLTTKLNALSTLLSKIENTNISNFTGGLERLSNSMAKLSTIKMPDYTRVAKGIQKLSQINPAQLQSASNALRSFSNSLGTLQGLQGSSQQISDLAKGISKLGYGSTITAINNMPRMADVLNKMMTTLSKAPKVSKNLIDMTNALANLSSQGAKVGSASNSIMNSFNRMSKSMNKTKTSTLSLASAFGKFYATYWVVIRGMKKLWSSVESSMNYIETLNYFNASFEQVAEKANLSSWEQLGYDSAQAYYESFSKRAEQLTQKMTGFQVTEGGMLENTRMKSLGIDPNQLMQYQSTFAQMSSSMGVASETSLKLSNALTMIGADLASVKNLDFKSVWNDMASGLAGMSRTLDKYGVNIRNANLQQKLNELGIKANINALNQNDKALLRTIILLDNTKYAWADMSDTIEQPANQLRLLKSNLSNLGRTIGNILLPMVAKVLPYLNALVIALQRLAEQLVKLLGFEDFDWGGIGSSDFDISALYDEADAFDNVAESAKKASDNLQGFDKINKLSDNSTNKTSSGLGVTNPLTNAFYDALSDYEKEWNSAFDRMENKTQKIANKIEKNFKNVFNRIKKGDFKGLGQDLGLEINSILLSADFEKLKNDAKNLGVNVAEFLNGAMETTSFNLVGSTVAEGVNTAINLAFGFSDTFDFKSAGISISDFINGFFETTDWSKAGKTISNLAVGLTETIKTAIKGIKGEEIGSALGEVIKEIDFLKIIKNAIGIIVFSVEDIIKFTAGFIDTAPLESAIIGALALMKFTGASKKIKEALTPVINKALGKLKPIAISLVVASVTISYAEEKLEPIWEENSFEDIVASSEQMFTDWLGDNPFALTVSDAFISISDSIVNTEDLEGALSLAWDDICNGDFKFDLVNLIEFPTYNEISDALQLLFADIDNGDFELSIFKPEWKLPSVKDFKRAWRLFKSDIKTGDFELSIFKPEWKLPSWNDISGGILEIGKKIENWFKEDVKPWFTLKKWSELFNSVKDGMISGWNKIVSWWKDTAIVNWWNNNVASWFSEKKWTFSGIKDGLKKAFESAISAIKGVWNGFAEFINGALNLEFKGFEKTFKIMGKKISVGLPAFEVSLGKLPTFQTGGFPEDGLFFANHNELVGQFNNGKTAVANNEQITQGIANAVYPAVYSAVVAGMQQGGGANVNITLEGDAQGLFNVVQQQSDRYFSQTGRLPFPT